MAWLGSRLAALLGRLIMLLGLVPAGRPALAGTLLSVESVSTAADGTQTNDGGVGAALSADGRYVAFVSGATNLVPGDTSQCRVLSNAGWRSGGRVCLLSRTVLDPLVWRRWCWRCF